MLMSCWNVKRQIESANVNFLRSCRVGSYLIGCTHADVEVDIANHDINKLKF